MARGKRGKNRKAGAKGQRVAAADPPATPFVRSQWRDIAIVGGIAVAIRIVFFLMYRSHNPLFDYPIMDGLYHQEWAQRIVDGDVIGDGVFFRAPLYPYFLALLYKLSGSSIAFAIVVQQLIGVATAVLLYLLGREYFDRRVALVAGIGAALYWPFLYFEGDLLIVTLIVFLDVATLLVTTQAMRLDSRARYTVAGLIFGLSAIARPNILIVLPFLPLVLWKSAGRTGRALAVRCVLLFAGAAVIITPVLIRNYFVGHDFVPIASQGGVNFYIGNNPQSDGRTAVVPGTRMDWWGGYEDAIRLAEEEAGRELTPSGVSNHYFAKGLAFVFGSPDRSIPLLGRKIYLFWAGGERSNNKNIYFFWHQSGLGKVPLPGFWLIGPLGLAGGVLLWRRRRELALLYLFVVTYAAGVIAFFVNARFRLPVVPVLILFAAWAAFHIIRSYRTRQFVTAAAVVAACVVAVDQDFLRFQENKTYKDPISHYTLGNAYIQKKRPILAALEYERALDIGHRYPNPGFPAIERNLNYNLGRIRASRGQCAQAVVLLEQIGGRDQYTVLAMELLARCYATLNRFGDAMNAWAAVLAAAPGHPGAADGLAEAAVAQARLLARAGDTARAVATLQRALESVPGNPAMTRELQALGGSN